MIPATWVPMQDKDMDKVVSESLVMSTSKHHQAAAEEVVPWYINNFPEAYFRRVGEATRSEHVKGLVALKGAGSKVSLTLTSPNEDSNFKDVTIMSSDGKPGVLHGMFQEMRTGKKRADFLHRVQSFSTFDASATLNIFTYGKNSEPPKTTEVDGVELLAKQDELSKLSSTPELFTKEKLTAFFQKCTPWFLRAQSLSGFTRLREMYEEVAGTEDTKVRIADGRGEGGAWVIIAGSNITRKTLLVKVTGLLFARGIDVKRLFLDVVTDSSTAVGNQQGYVGLIRILVAPGTEATLPKGTSPFAGSVDKLDSEAWRELAADISRARWLDDSVLDLALKKCPGLGMKRAEILTAFCAMLHGPLSKINQYGFSRPNLLAVIGNPSNMAHSSAVADLFIARFDTAKKMSEGDFQKGLAALRERLGAIVDETTRTLLLKMADAIEATLRSNVNLPNRYGLAFRISPKIMVKPDVSQPFGVFFVHGDNFDGFHNRFQNIARGGLRLVSPPTNEQFLVESSRVYDEVYGLSFAQELKNKDIPEGGSKAVCCINVARAGDKYRALRGGLKAFVNSILDLIVTTDHTKKYNMDYLGVDEPIFLGPDEQVIPEDIDWIIKQAGKRGYFIPPAFMSSKAKAGINHKTYGVTSEGVSVFLDVALRNCGIQPDKQPFTVKITGGPDGDVAGNLMRILIRDYGTNARIVGVADGFGCAEDPDGLPQDELLRLFNAALPISELNPAKVGKNGMVYLANTEEGAQKRNTMHNRVKADVFVPGGGRPYTMHKGNWEQFLDPVTGKPSSPLIVEGANLFLTAEARLGLFEKAGVRIVKDSSANKCGVITSSYEICSSMLLAEDEFLAIKDEVVQDVLKRLRELARLEAELMFREYANYPGALPEFSERISKSINRGYGAIRKSFANVQPGDEIYKQMLPLFIEDHLPRKLGQVAGDRVAAKIPLDYLRNAFANMLASKLLYREGIHFLESQPEERLAELAMTYVKEERTVRELVGMVGGSDLPDDKKAKVRELLQQGGARCLLGVY